MFLGALACLGAAAENAFDGFFRAFARLLARLLLGLSACRTLGFRLCRIGLRFGLGGVGLGSIGLGSGSLGLCQLLHHLFRIGARSLGALCRIALLHDRLVHVGCTVITPAPLRILE
ncbi:hypothetical protein D3C87_1608560 [compost metagenome]